MTAATIGDEGATVFGYLLLVFAVHWKGKLTLSSQFVDDN